MPHPPMASVAPRLVVTWSHLEPPVGAVTEEGPQWAISRLQKSIYTSHMAVTAKALRTQMQSKARPKAVV